MKRAILMVLTLAIATGCSDSGTGGTSLETSSSSTTVAEPASTSTTSTTSSTTTTSVPTTTTSTVPTTTTTVQLPEFPPETESLTHGGDAWVVVLAASEEYDDPVLVAAEGHARDAGYNTGPTDCDVGASAILGLPEDGHYYTVSVYLSDEADALAALAAFEARDVPGAVGLVQTFCMD